MRRDRSQYSARAFLAHTQARFRPPNSVETREGGDIVVEFDENLKSVRLRSAQVMAGPEKDGFTFDRVFPPGTKQHEVFDYGVKE